MRATQSVTVYFLVIFMSCLLTISSAKNNVGFKLNSQFEYDINTVSSLISGENESRRVQQHDRLYGWTAMQP